MVSWEIVKRFFEPALHDKKAYTGVLLFMAVRPFESVVITLLLNKAVYFLEHNNEYYFYLSLGVYVIRVVCYQLYNFFMRNMAINAFWGFYKYLIPKYLRTYINADNNQIESIGTGRMLGIIDKGIDTRADLLIQACRMGSYAVVQILFAGYLFRNIHRSLPIFQIIIISVVLLLSIYLIKGSIHRRVKRVNSMDECTRHNIKIYMSKFEILMSNKIDLENTKLLGLLQQTELYDKKKTFYEHIAFNISKVAIYVITCGVFFYLGYSYFNYNTIQFSNIILYLGLITALDNGIRYSTDLFKAFSKNFVRVDKLRKSFDNISSIYGLNYGKTLTLTHGSISLSHISYGYNVNNPVFSNFSLELQAKKKTALVGPSGGGKSTLIKLIAGYIRPDSGNILIDRQSIVASNGDHVSLQSYYAHIGYLTQEPSVFDGTVRENLEYGINNSQGVMIKSQGKKIEQKIESGESYNGELSNIISLAKCEWIYDLPDGLDTEIGERGVRLSGGQKQRLAIAKIMLKNPSIILLDEPTSALDSYNEEQVTIALNNLFKNKTVIVIAHRLQTVKHADEIIFISDGTITERGTHEELLALHGEYYKMVELQSGF